MPQKALPSFLFFKISLSTTLPLPRVLVWRTPLLKCIPSILPCHTVPLWQSSCHEKQTEESNARWLDLQRDTYISVIHSLCISSNLVSVWHLTWWIAVILPSVACGCFKASAVWIWEIANADRKAPLASRASALSSVKPLAKIHSEIMGTVRYGCSWRTCGVIQRAWWTGIAASSTSVKGE